jgi:hypothetical protein
MKKYSMLFLVLSLISNSVMSQTRKEVQVAKAVESLKESMIRADSAGLSALVADSLSYGHSSGKIENKATFIQSITSGRSVFVSIELLNQHIQVYQHTAVVRHVFQAITNDSGKPGKVKLSIVTVWIRHKGRWQLITRQAVKIPD